MQFNKRMGIQLGLILKGADILLNGNMDMLWHLIKENS
jgi:hypothetical protein